MLQKHIRGLEGVIVTIRKARSRTRQPLNAAEIEEALGATLQQLRQSRGLNQTELGRRLGVSLQQMTMGRISRTFRRESARKSR